MTIQEVQIVGVRGIRSAITLPLQGRSLLLHGDNGTGKSSIERALRWALVGDEEPTAEDPFTSEESFRRHVLAGPDEPFVRVTFRDGSHIEVRPGTYDAGPTGQEVRAACQRGNPFLRRTELLDVLSSRPVDRFKYFEGFLGLDRADELLKELGDAKATHERRGTSIDSKLKSELAALAPLFPGRFEHPTSSMDSAEAAARTWASTLQIAGPKASWEELSTALETAASATDEDLGRTRGALTALVGDLKGLAERWAATQAELPEAFVEQIDALASEAPAEDLELLRHAQRHFEREEGELCPVCEQTVDWSTTREAIRERVDGLAALSDLLERRERAARSLWSRWEDLSRLQVRAESTTGPSVAWDQLASTLPGLDLLREPGTAASDQTRSQVVQAIGGRPLLTFLDEARAELQAKAEAAASAVPTADQLPEINLCASLVARIMEKRPAMRLLESELASVRSEGALQAAVYEAVRRARQDVARSTLESIAETVAEFYFAIHPPGNPEEATGAPSIDVQRHSGGTAFVRGMFAERTVRDPRWVYSDGHLDTVGICIFLALRRFRADREGDAKLLVLDDIIISIDLGHARRLLELLRDRFGDHQLVMLTHNRLFAHWCVGMIPGLTRLEIRSWSLESGPRLGEHRDAYEALEASLDDASPKEISQGMMTLLDEWLAEARFAYQLSVQAKRDEAYTLTDIWEPFGSALRKMGKKMGSDLGGALAAIERLRDVTRIRNYLSAHENEFAREFPRESIVDISRDVLRLVDALYCRTCRTFAEPVPRRSDPSIVHCRCKQIQYVPQPESPT